MYPQQYPYQQPYPQSHPQSHPQPYPQSHPPSTILDIIAATTTTVYNPVPYITMHPLLEQLYQIKNNLSQLEREISNKKGERQESGQKMEVSNMQSKVVKLSQPSPLSSSSSGFSHQQNTSTLSLLNQLSQNNPPTTSPNIHEYLKLLTPKTMYQIINKANTKIYELECTVEKGENMLKEIIEKIQEKNNENVELRGRIQGEKKRLSAAVEDCPK